MKTLPQIVDDLRTLSVFLMDNAAQIEELSSFFGGPVAPVSHPVAPPARPPVTVAMEPPPEKLRLHDIGSRKLTPEEKAAIRTDWQSLPKHLQTAENRRALSAKYKCAPIQVFALNRSDGHQEKLAEMAGSRRARPNGHPATPAS